MPDCLEVLISLGIFVSVGRASSKAASVIGPVSLQFCGSVLSLAAMVVKKSFICVASSYGGTAVPCPSTRLMTSCFPLEVVSTPWSVLQNF